MSWGVLGGLYADVAQLVEHHLAKVRVAGSNPVVRSEARLCGTLAVGQTCSYGGVAEWLRQGPAKPCTRVRFPAPPLDGGPGQSAFLASTRLSSLLTRTPQDTYWTLVRTRERCATRHRRTWWSSTTRRITATRTVCWSIL